MSNVIGNAASTVANVVRPPSQPKRRVNIALDLAVSPVLCRALLNARRGGEEREIDGEIEADDDDGQPEMSSRQLDPSTACCFGHIALRLFDFVLTRFPLSTGASLHHVHTSTDVAACGVSSNTDISKNALAIACSTTRTLRVGAAVRRTEEPVPPNGRHQQAQPYPGWPSDCCQCWSLLLGECANRRHPYQEGRVHSGSWAWQESSVVHL